MQTVLLASLTAAIVPPFFRMQFAKAEKHDETPQEILNRYAEKYTKLREKIDKSSDPDNIEKWEKKQDKIVKNVEELVEGNRQGSISKLCSAARLTRSADMLHRVLRRMRLDRM